MKGHRDRAADAYTSRDRSFFSRDLDCRIDNVRSHVALLGQDVSYNRQRQVSRVIRGKVRSILTRRSYGGCCLVE